jgi:sirohydrochlorin ferrochelatase
MIVALIDNGSLEPGAHRNLRSVAAAVSERTGVKVRPVSWKHSDRVPEAELDGAHAWTLASFIHAMFALGQREFVFVPFFISPQGAIGSALFRDLETLQGELGEFDFRFTDGLAGAGVIPTIMAEHVRTCIKTCNLVDPPVLVVDHGGPSTESAELRDQLARQIMDALAPDVTSVCAASMEGMHPPLLADWLARANLQDRDVVVAPLFLSPGRHAGVDGDIGRICRASPARTHLTELVGTHPLVIDALADALRTTLSTVHAHTFA